MLFTVAGLPPEYRKASEWAQLADYFLRRRVIYKTGDPTQIVGLAKSSYPIYGLAHSLYGLSALGYGNHAALDEIWAMMEGMKDSQGRYLQEYPGSKPPFNAGKAGQPSKWITLYMLLAMKYRDQALR